MKDLKVMMMMMMMMMIDDDEIAVISLHCLLFSMSKNKYLKQISKSATKESIEIWTSGPQSLFFPNKITNLIALYSTNQVTD